MIGGVDDGLSYVCGARYRVKSQQTRGYGIDADYIFEEAVPGFGVIHYLFRSCDGGWRESFTDLTILLGEITIRPYGKGKRRCNALTVSTL